MAGLPLPTWGDFAFVTGMLADMNIAKVTIIEYIQDLVGVVSPTINSILVLYIIIYGYALMRGAVDHPGRETMTRFAKMIIVVAFSTQISYYTSDIINVLWGLPNEIIAFLNPATSWFSTLLPAAWVNATTDFVMTLIYGVMSYLADFGQKMATQDANVLNNAASMGLFVLGGGLSGLSFAIVMVCKVSIAVLLALSPLFIIFILFEKTKPFFDSWINAIVTFMLTLVLFYLTVYLIFPILLKTIFVYYIYQQVEGGTLETKHAYQLMILLGIYFLVIKQVVSTAASIARGYAVNTSGGRWDNWDQSVKQNQQQNPGQIAKQSGQ